MSALAFQRHHKEFLREALVIAEEMTSDFFQLTGNQWMRARYDILTLESLQPEEISSHALALVAKYQGSPWGRVLKSCAFDFYRVCVQDHNILQALDAKAGLTLLPLLSYVLTHELVHLVRFSRFQARFEASEGERQQEERLVHRLTRQILAPLNFLDISPVIQYYEGYWQGGWQYAHL